MGCPRVLLAALLALCAVWGAGAEGEPFIALVSVADPVHLLPMTAIAQELQARGYRVALASSERAAVPPDLPFISTGPAPRRNSTESLLALQARHAAATRLELYRSVTDGVRYLHAEEALMLPRLREAFEADRPDLLVVDRSTLAGHDVAQLLGLPVIVNNPLLLLNLDDPPVHVPAPYSGFLLDTHSVWERCINALLRLRFRLAMIEGLRPVNAYRTEELGLPALRSRADLYGQAMVLTNTAFGVEQPRSLPPLVPLVGAVLAPSSPSPSPPATGAQDAALVELGGNAPLLGGRRRVALEAGLAAAGLRVIWSDGDGLADLADPAVRLLVCSGDLPVAQQALVRERPVLSLPWHVDQLESGRRLAQLGVGRMLLHDVDAASVEAAAAELLTPETDAAVKRMSKILVEPGGVRVAATLVESTLYVGTDALTPQDDRMPWWQVLLLDVYLVYGAVLCGVAVILRTCWSAFWSLIGGKVKLD